MCATAADHMSRGIVYAYAQEEGVEAAAGAEQLASHEAEELAGGHPLHEEAPLVPRWPLFVYLCGAMFCLLTSAVCHLLCCKSEEVSRMLWMYDYVVRRPLPPAARPWRAPADAGLQCSASVATVVCRALR
eukprot:scaffold2213_cov444-Prasinococcus_capsulatus_cf.AAC.16